MNTLCVFANTLVDRMTAVCRWALLALGVAMTFLILLQVFFRFVIYLPFPWSEEAARYLMIWMGMLGSVIALKQQRHIGVTFFVEKLPKLPQKLVQVFVYCTMAGFLGILFWQGLVFARFNADQLSPAMRISMLIPFSAIPAGAAMMILVIATDLLVLFFPVKEAR